MSERAPLPVTTTAPERGRVLLLCPHADDDVIGAGGTCAQHVAQGDFVQVVIAFSGEAGDPDGRYDAAEYAALRQKEARAGGAHLGFEHYQFLGYPEGHEPSDVELVQAAHHLAGVIRQAAPDIIYCCWIGEYHLDHYVLARAARLALAIVGFTGTVWGYEVWTALIPTWINDVTNEFEKKSLAMREHASQMDYHDLTHKAFGLMAQRSMYCDRTARHAEAFAPFGEAPPEDLALLGS